MGRLVGLHVIQYLGKLVVDGVKVAGDILGIQRNPFQAGRKPFVFFVFFWCHFQVTLKRLAGL